MVLLFSSFWGWGRGVSSCLVCNVFLAVPLWGWGLEKKFHRMRNPRAMHKGKLHAWSVWPNMKLYQFQLKPRKIGNQNVSPRSVP